MSSASPPQAETGGVTTKLSIMQRITIANLRRGLNGSVPVTISAAARADRLLSIHDALRSTTPPDVPRLTVTVLLARVLTVTLMDHAALRSALVDDEHIKIHDDVHLGIAVALDDGALVVPIIHGTSRYDMTELATQLADRVRRARSGQLAPQDVKGGTFTLSSTGPVRIPVYGTPLLPAGHTAVLLASAAVEQPVVGPDHNLEVGTVLPLSLTFDHAVVNGVPALEFLADLVGRIEAPDTWLGTGTEGRSA